MVSRTGTDPLALAAGVQEGWVGGSQVGTGSHPSQQQPRLPSFPHSCLQGSVRLGYRLHTSPQGTGRVLPLPPVCPLLIRLPTRSNLTHQG